MKKLFTLIALVAFCLGAKAITVVDAEVDFSKYSDISEVQFASWRGSEAAFARLSIQDGCLHFHSEEATDPSWDCQFFPIGGVSADVGTVYTLHYKIKGTVAQNCSMLGFGQTPYGQFPITTEWVEGTVDYEATSTDGNILMQCGDYVGDWDIAYLKITHEEREQRPVTWENILVNGDAEGEYGEEPCAYSKEWGTEVGEDGLPQPHVAYIESDGGNKVFVSHAKAVEPPLLWDSDGEQWGTQHSAGDPMPDNTWQNQFWINFPKAMKEGEQVKISFRYKASKVCTVSSQDHQETPGNYLGGGQVGNINFTTEWQTYEKTYSSAGNAHSIAFNLGEGENYKEDIDFYFDDLNVSLMVLDEGYFVASTNTESGLVDYDLDNATQFVYDEDLDAYTATVGTAGDEDSWVNEIMISTVRGNDKAFKAATLKVTEAVVNDPETWINYVEGSNAKIKLPAAGVWAISINTEYEMMNFVKIEGEEDKLPIEIVPNREVVVVNGLERDYTASEQPGDEEEGIAAGTGQPWDNQFFIVANRPLAAGEETVIEFDYVATVDARTTTQCHAAPGAYLHWAAIGDVNFTTVEQSFSAPFTVPAEADNMESIAFNMAEIKGACQYTIKNIVWKLADGTESLIDMEGTRNFYVKEGANTNPHIFGEEDGIGSIVVRPASNSVSYNLAGQRVTKGYKGIVVKSGKKYIAK